MITVFINAILIERIQYAKSHFDMLVNIFCKLTFFLQLKIRNDKLEIKYMSELELIKLYRIMELF